MTLPRYTVPVGEPGEKYISLAPDGRIRWLRAGGNVDVVANNPSAARVLTLIDPGADDDFVFTTATQTLSNKTLASPTITGVIATPLGSAAAPSRTFTGDLNTGDYSPGADQYAISTGGVVALQADASQRLIAGGAAAATALLTLTPSLQLRGGTDALTTLLIGHWEAADGISSLRFLKSRNATIGSFTVVTSGDVLGQIMAFGDDGVDYGGRAAVISFNADAAWGDTDHPGRIVFYTTADGANDVTERLRIDSSGDFTYFDGADFILGTVTGTKLGTTTLQKLSFYNATPVVQPAAQADAAGGATVDAEARTAINGLLGKMRTLGVIAT